MFNDATILADGNANLSTIDQASMNSTAYSLAEGNSNQQAIMQTGSSQTAASLVFGDGNTTSQTQGDLNGSGQLSVVYLEGNNNGAVTSQVGNDHVAEVSAFGDANLFQVTQTGSNHASQIFGQGDSNSVLVEQIGDNNASMIDINGSFNTFDVFQRQEDNDLSSVVAGNTNDVSVWQGGRGNLVDMEIQGDSNLVDVEERLTSRRNSDTLIFIEGNDNKLYAAARSGSGQYMNFDITGDDNLIDSYQFHNGVSLDFTTDGVAVTGNTADIDQAGAFSSISLLLTGSMNDIVMQQGGPSSNASNRIEGLGGADEFHIGGDDGEVTLYQSGIQNIIQGAQLSNYSAINVSQTGSFNTAVISQL